MNGTKLWVTDGFSEGSTMIVEGDILPGDLLDSFLLVNLLNFLRCVVAGWSETKLIFSARDAS
jgi:hypothetical protein